MLKLHKHKHAGLSESDVRVSLGIKVLFGLERHSSVWSVYFLARRTVGILRHLV